MPRGTKATKQAKVRRTTKRATLRQASHKAKQGVKAKRTVK